MPHLLLLLVIVVVLFLVISKLFAPSLEPEIDKVLKGGDVAALLKAIGERRPGARPDAYNRAIRRIWDEYQRPAAIPLIRALAEGHGDSRIAQYWLQQVSTVEPELAAASFDEAFMAEHYKPEVAATCGKVG
jgi:hypothetical protein